MNQLYYGDCLDVLRKLYKQHPDGFIDLIYIDPPFNSKRNYNILFESIDLKDANAQKQAFADTWSNYDYKDTIQELAELDLDLYKLLKALDEIKVSDSAVAYLTTMSIRIWYMHKLLKDTGSFYLHCDSTMSHYLKLVCDLIFGEKNFRNEIVWKRKTGRGETNQKSNKFGNSTDTILFYAVSDNNIFNSQFNEDAAGYDEYVESSFKHVDENGRRFMSDNLASPTLRKNLVYEYKGFNPPKNGWAISKDKMEEWDKAGKLIFPKTKDGRIRRKRYMDELKGRPVQNLWDDISVIPSQSSERLGYPTQKPVALLERIIAASTNENDLVADFFCGCGTTIAAAQKLNRQWLGADISHLAVRLILKRLVETYGKDIRDKIKIDGFPADIASAKELSLGKGGRFDFQDWVIEVLLNGVKNPKKVADGGYDGYMTFEMADSSTKSHKELILIEVKSGGVGEPNMREFESVLRKQNAAMGIYVCFDDNVTNGMKKVVKEAGYFMPELFGQQYPKIQIITVEELMKHHNQAIKMPRTDLTTFKKAQKATSGNKSRGLFE